MFNYEPISEEEAEAARFQLMKKGTYEGVVTSAKDAMSASGNSMIDITITAYDQEGKAYEIRDFLVAQKSMMWKIVRFCKSANLSKEYKEGRFCSQLALNRHVMVKIDIEEGKEIPEDKLQGKPIGSKYPDRNKISEYVVDEIGQGKTNRAESINTDDSEIDEDVPF